MISAYEEGMNLFEIGDYFAASKKFLEAEILFPQSQWAPKSVLMASYSYYMQSYYSLAIENIKRYFKNDWQLISTTTTSVQDTRMLTANCMNMPSKFDRVLKIIANISGELEQ